MIPIRSDRGSDCKHHFSETEIRETVCDRGGGKLEGGQAKIRQVKRKEKKSSVCVWTDSGEFFVEQLSVPASVSWLQTSMVAPHPRLNYTALPCSLFCLLSTPPYSPVLTYAPCVIVTVKVGAFSARCWCWSWCCEWTCVMAENLRKRIVKSIRRALKSNVVNLFKSEGGGAALAWSQRTARESQALLRPVSVALRLICSAEEVAGGSTCYFSSLFLVAIHTFIHNCLLQNLSLSAFSPRFPGGLGVEH